MQGGRFCILMASSSFQLASNKLLCLFVFNINTCIMAPMIWTDISWQHLNDMWLVLMCLQFTDVCKCSRNLVVFKSASNIARVEKWLPVWWKESWFLTNKQLWNFIIKTRRNSGRNSEEVLLQLCPLLALIGSKFAHQCPDRPVFCQKKVTRVCIESVLPKSNTSFTFEIKLRHLLWMTKNVQLTSQHKQTTKFSKYIVPTTHN